MPRSVPVARRNVFADRRRLAVSVAGVGAAIALILLLQGLWSGFQVQISAYEDHVGADLFVAERGTRNFFGVPSVLPIENVQTIRDLPGVQAAAPAIVRFAVLDLHGRKQFAILVGSEPGEMGGPWEVVSGRGVRGDDEIVVDRSLAEQHGIALGSDLDVMGRRFRVVGLSAGTRSWMAGFVFTTHRAVESLLKMPGSTSFVLVQTSEPSLVAQEIRDATGLTPITPPALGDADRNLLSRVLKGPLTLMLAIAFIAGTLIIALTIYSATVERAREYGIAKAMGARGGRLFEIVLGQAVIVATLGAIAGYLLFRGGAWLVVTLRPQMWIQTTLAGVGAAVAAALIMATLAASLPTRRVARLDPASVYRG